MDDTPKDAPALRPRRGRVVSPIAGVFVGLLALVPLSGLFHDAAEAVPGPFLVISDVLDPSDPVVASSRFDSMLVQWGTDQPYTGNGPPGIQLKVVAPGDVIGWTVEAWANTTVPSPVPANVCSQDGVHFDHNDWMYRAEGGGSNGTGQFTAVPTTVAQRLGPNGDQCHLRVQATDVWRITICIEGEPVGDYDERGPPRGLYDAPDGRHLDIWDFCFYQLQQVPG